MKKSDGKYNFDAFKTCFQKDKNQRVQNYHAQFEINRTILSFLYQL